MNFIAEDIKVWKFPESIGYEVVHCYLDEFSEKTVLGDMVFDLSETDTVHSSFIGFLIHAKREIEKNSGSLSVVFSKRCRELFTMLDLYDYFAAPSLFRKRDQKSA